MRSYEGHRHYPIRKTTLLDIQNGSSKGETNGINRSHAMKKRGWLSLLVSPTTSPGLCERPTLIYIYSGEA